MWLRAGAGLCPLVRPARAPSRRLCHRAEGEHHLHVFARSRHARGYRRPRRKAFRRHARHRRLQDRPAEDCAAGRKRSRAAARARSRYREGIRLSAISARRRTSELIYFRMSLSAETLKEKNGQPLEFETGTTMQVADAGARRPEAAHRAVRRSRPALLLQAARRVRLVDLRLRQPRPPRRMDHG